jgi:riboflavin kinase/FMN adenylyltransferase
MNSYEVHGLRVSSTTVRAALAAGDMQQAAKLLGHPYTISGHVVHGRKLGSSWRSPRRGGRRLSHPESAL